MARLVRPLLIGSACLLLVTATGLTEPGLSASLEDALIDGDYEQAKKTIRNLKNPKEKLFFQGLRFFLQQKYHRARDKFEKLSETYPDSHRAEDAVYYLDRITLHAPSNEAPTVRVQLAGAKTLSGSTSGPAVVRDPAGSLVARLESGESWSIASGYLGGGELTAGNETVNLDNGSTVKILPAGDNARVQYDNQSYRGHFKIKKINGTYNLVNVLPLNHYLYGVIRKEIAPGWPIATVKAQTVAARSFAVSQLGAETEAFDLKSSHLAQVYGGAEAETRRVRQAVESTRGEVLTYKNRVIPAYFHANSGGHIETASSVWNEDRTPYIVAKPDTWSEGTRHSNWTASLSRATIRRGLANDNYPQSADDPAPEVVERLPSGRSQTISYRIGYGSRHSLSANDFRMAVGPNKLKSTWIRSIEPSGSDFEVRGRGWGHGIGMSQWGAYEMGKAGLDYRRILSFYYEKARLMGQYGIGTGGSHVQ